MAQLIQNLDVSHTMKQAGQRVWELVQKDVSLMRIKGKVANGRIYSARVDSSTEFSSEAIKEIAVQLAEQLLANKATAWIPLSLPSAVEHTEMCANGALRVVHAWDVIRNGSYIAFEIGAGNELEVHVEMKVTLL